MWFVITRNLWLCDCLLFSPPSGGSSQARLMRGVPILMSVFWDQGCHILAGLDSSIHHNKARDCIQITLEDRYMIILGLYLVRQRHLVSTFCVHIIVHTLFLFICCRFTTTQKNNWFIDNKLYMHYDFFVFFLGCIIGLLVWYSPARTRVPCVVFTIGGVTARLIRR